eukprot:gene4140-8228_t
MSMDDMRLVSMFAFATNAVTFHLEHNTYLRNLKQLYIDSNNISILNYNQFQHLHKLELLTLQQNPISDISCCHLCGLNNNLKISFGSVTSTLPCGCEQESSQPLLLECPVTASTTPVTASTPHSFPSSQIVNSNNSIINCRFDTCVEFVIIISGLIQRS